MNGVDGDVGHERRIIWKGIEGSGYIYIGMFGGNCLAEERRVDTIP